MRPALSCYQSHRKILQEKKMQIKSLINIDPKIFNKILESQIKWHLRNGYLTGDCEEQIIRSL
jgi:hypothetical protein